MQEYYCYMTNSSNRKKCKFGYIKIIKFERINFKNNILKSKSQNLIIYLLKTNNYQN